MEFEEKKMGLCRLTSWSIFLPLLVVMMCANGSGGREMMGGKTTRTNVLRLPSSRDGTEKGDADHDHLHHHGGEGSVWMQPSEMATFKLDDLKIGKRMAVYFPKADPSPPPLLPREEADSIPFSSSRLPKLLELFSIPEQSPQAKLMQQILLLCEKAPIEGETKLCATSLESMLDFTRSILGADTQFKALATKRVNTLGGLLQNYTVVKVSQDFSSHQNLVVVCHATPYLYTIFYCHSQENDTKAFTVSLAAADHQNINGEDEVEALVICHMDTSKWTVDSALFHTVGIQPGKSVCHFLPWDTYAWVPILPTHASV